MDGSKEEEDAAKVLVDLVEAVDTLNVNDGSEGENDEDSDIDKEELARDTTLKQTSVSDAEDAGMWPKSTIYIYRRGDDLDLAIQSRKPIAGILKEKGGSFEFCTSNIDKPQGAVRGYQHVAEIDASKIDSIFVQS